MNDKDVLELLSLPPEVRVKIFKYIPVKYLHTLRILNKQIKSEVEEHLDFHVTLNQTFRRFRHLFALRISALHVEKLTYHFSNPGPLLAHPCRLTKLHLDGPINSSNLVNILRHCKEIRTLVLHHGTMTCPGVVSNTRVVSCLYQNLRNLSNLDVQLIQGPIGRLREPHEEMNVGAIMTLEFPVLRVLRLNFCIYGAYCKLFLLLMRHATTLEELELNVGEGAELRQIEPTNNLWNMRGAIDTKVLNSMRLKTFIFRDENLDTNAFAESCIIGIVEAQKRLEVLKLEVPGSLKIPSFKTILMNNGQFLKELKVSYFNHPERDQRRVGSLSLDLEMFQQAKELRSLELCCSTTSRIGRESTPIKLLNLHCFPQSLKKMQLHGFLVDPEEVPSFSKKMGGLESLEVCDAGSMMYSKVLNSLLQNCSSLKYLRVHPITTRASGESGWYAEVNDLCKLYQHFLGTEFDPIDDLDGFEVSITDSDRTWISQNLSQ